MFDRRKAEKHARTLAQQRERYRNDAADREEKLARNRARYAEGKKVRAYMHSHFEPDRLEVVLRKKLFQ